MASQAQQLIGRLHQQGYSNADIARAIQRDSSIVSQVAKGKKSGDVYVPALRAMSQGRNVPNVPRRQGAQGKPAKVRQPSVIREEEGAQRITTMYSKTPSGKQVQGVVRHVAFHQGTLGVVVTVKVYQGYGMEQPTSRRVSLWTHGVTPNYVNNKIAQYGTLDAAISAELESLPNIEVAQGITDITINAMY